MVAPRLRRRIVGGLIVVMCLLYVPLMLMVKHATSSVTNPPATIYIPGPVLTTPCHSVGTPVESLPPIPSSTLKPHAVFHMRIVVFTYRRLKGLQRLMKSLNSSWYLGHDVSLTIYVDFPKKGTTIADDDGTRSFVSSVHWPHGTLTVHRRLINAGLKRTIIESWYPSADSAEVTAFFEDDIEVSPLWYLWATRAMERYAPNRVVSDRLLGISLFRPIHDELSGRDVSLPSDIKVFALQQPCSWGAVYLPRPWRAFRDWYDDFTKSGDRDPRVTLPDGGSPTSNSWDRHSSWKKYLIMLMVERDWFMVYPNPPERMVLSTNHLMPGEHPTPPKALFELPLLDPTSSPAAAFLGVDAVTAENVETALDGILPALAELKFYDVLFRNRGVVGR